MSDTINQSNNPPEYLRPFLTDTGSLTFKLKKMTGSATVQVITGSIKPTDWWAKYYLNLKCDRLFQREILMTSRNYVCWYARSYIPDSTWYLNAKFFKQFACKNLGDMLFNSHHVRRFTSNFFIVGKKDAPYYWLPQEIELNCDKLWLRLSVYSFNNKSSFYVTEIFLPELRSCLQQIGQPTYG